MRPFRFILVLVLAAVCCTAFATAAVVPLSENDNGRTVSARVGDTFLLRLPENPSTGYRWTVTVTPGLCVTSDRHSPSILHRIGAPGTHEWQIRVMQPGDQIISGVYSRPWAPDEPGKTFTLMISAAGGRSPGSLPISRISRQEIFDLLKR